MRELNRRDVLLGCAGAAAIPLIQNVSAGADDAVNESEERNYTRIVSSPDVTSNGADFRVETEDRWNSMGLSVYPVSVRLRITNRSDQPLLFPFFDTFSMALYNPDGSEHVLDGGRNGTRPVMRPLLLGPGQDFSIVPTVHLHFSRDTRELRLVYEDGTGTILTSGLLSGGQYAAGFTYAVTERWVDGFSRHIPEGAVWTGSVNTDPVAFEVALD